MELARDTTQMSKGSKRSAGLANPTLLPPFASKNADLTVIIETPKGSRNKYAGYAHLKELAPVYVMLAIDEASHVSGATVAVTGGKTDHDFLSPCSN